MELYTTQHLLVTGNTLFISILASDGKSFRKGLRLSVDMASIQVSSATLFIQTELICNSSSNVGMDGLLVFFLVDYRSILHGSASGLLVRLQYPWCKLCFGVCYCHHTSTFHRCCTCIHSHLHPLTLVASSHTLCFFLSINTHWSFVCVASLAELGTD